MAITLDDVRDHLNITDSEHDYELSTTLDAALARLAHEVGPLSVSEVVERHDGYSGDLLLRTRPAVSLTSLRYIDSETTIDLDNVYLDTGTGSIRWESGYGAAFGPGAVLVTYQAGRADLPADLRYAVLELVRHLWTSQRGSGSAPARAGLTGGEPTSDRMPTFPDLPYSVQKMIGPYQQHFHFA